MEAAALIAEFRSMDSEEENRKFRMTKMLSSKIMSDGIRVCLPYHHNLITIIYFALLSASPPSLKIHTGDLIETLKR